MRRLNLVLGSVLIAQLLLAGVLIWNHQQYRAAKPGQPLLTFEREKVNRIVIDTPDEGAITLRENGQNWSIPSRDGFPAARSKVDDFLAALGDLKPRLPVAVTEDASQRFHVATKDFERRITLKNGKDILATLYLGNAAGPNRIFARSKGEQAVYEINFGTWQASTEPKQWMDRDLLQHKPEDIVRIDLPSFTLQRQGDKWQLAGLSTGTSTDESAASRIVDQLAYLTFEDVEGKADDKTVAESAPKLSYTLMLKNGRSVKYHFSKPDKSDDYLLRTSDQDYVFKVSKQVVAGIHDLKRDALVKRSNDKATKPATTVGATGGRADKPDSHS